MVPGRVNDLPAGERDVERYGQYLTTHFGSCRSGSPDELESYRRHYAKVYLPLLPDARDACLLDVGCGMGHFLYFLDKAGYTNYLGIDLGQEQVDFCSTHVTQKVSLVGDTVGFLHDRPGQCDAIVSIDVLEHIPDAELLPLVIAMRRALRPEGRLLLSVPNAACITSLAVRYGDLTHHRLFTEGSMTQLLRMAGFETVEILPNEKRVVRSFRSRWERWNWSCRDRLIRWLLSEFHRHLMEGSYPQVQTVNLIGLARK